MKYQGQLYGIMRGRPREAASLAALMVFIAIAWDTWAVYPLKILVVFFHELSHALMAYATGGSVLEIRLVAAEGGYCVTQGGWPMLILTAGYLGSLVWGSAILLCSTKTRGAKAVTGMLGALTLGVGLFFVRPFLGFGFAFSLVAGAAMLAAGTYLPPSINGVLLRIIGLTSCLYVVLDIKSDTIDRSELRSDARMLAELTGVPTVVWGVVWILVALAFIYAVIRLALREGGAPQGSV